MHANNRFSNPTHQLILNLPPEPWVGRLDAPVVVLNLNPGVAEGDETSPLLPKLRDAAFANLAQEPVQWPLYHLDPAFASHPGGRWWRRCLRPWINVAGDQAVARHVVGLEFHGYHSKSFGPLPVTLPSQDYVFHQLASALASGAVVVGLRGRRLWSTAVPELVDRPNVWWASNPRAPSVSELNIGARACEEAVNAIRIADATCNG